MLAFAVYALAAPPGFYWLDSGELSAAGVGLGVGHPTGFPLYCILVKAASLLPFGELAFRVNLLSAAAAALSVLWVCRLVCESCRDDVAALAGAVAAGGTLAVSLTFMRQATVAEIYAPNAALLALALLYFGRIARGGGPRDGLLLAVAAGAGLALHSTFALLGPPIVAILIVRLYRGARWPLVAPLLTVTVAGGLYLYLPVRSEAGLPAPIEWEDTSELGGFGSHVTGSRIRSSFGGQMRSTTTEVWTENASIFFREIADQFTLALLAGLAGLLWLARSARTRWLAGALGFLVLGDAVYSFWVNPMGLTDLQNGVPFAVALCAAAGAGVAWFARSVGRAAPFAGAVAAVVLIVPAAMVSWSPVWAASSGDLPRDWSEAGFDSTPARGIALVESDSLASGLIFLGVIEGARPDVAVQVRQVMADRRRTLGVLERAHREGGVNGIFDGRTQVTWEVGSIPPPPGWLIRPGVPLSTIVRYEDGMKPASAADFRTAALELIRLSNHPSARDASATLNVAQAFGVLGRRAYSLGYFDEAQRAYDAALAVRPRFARVLVNRAVLAASRGRLADAIRFTERALAIEPNHEKALLNVARYYHQMKDPDKARRRVERLLRVAPRNVEGWLFAAALDAEAGRADEAGAHFDRALELEPDNQRVLLAAAGYRYSLQDRAGARKLIARLLVVNPRNVDALLFGIGLDLDDGKPADARAKLDRARAIAPDHPGVVAAGKALGTPD